MTDTVPLYLYQAEDRHLAALKSAKEALGLDVLVRPVTAQPGQGGRMLCFAGEHPGFVSSSALVQSKDEVPAAIIWAIDWPGATAPKSHLSESGWLSRAMGREVREIV